VDGVPISSANIDVSGPPHMPEVWPAALMRAPVDRPRWSRQRPNILAGPNVTAGTS
jgi:hypothetical protein